MKELRLRWFGYVYGGAMLGTPDEGCWRWNSQAREKELGQGEIYGGGEGVHAGGRVMEEDAWDRKRRRRIDPPHKEKNT